MLIPQLSVFLENKSGRLTEVLETLGKADFRITAMSVADTSEFGILRLIVTEPEKARILLKENHFTVNITDVISLMAPNEARYYGKILRILSDQQISIEYTYSFSRGSKSIIILKCNNNEQAVNTLKEHEMELLNASDLYKI